MKEIDRKIIKLLSYGPLKSTLPAERGRHAMLTDGQIISQIRYNHPSAWSTVAKQSPVGPMEAMGGALVREGEASRPD